MPAVVAEALAGDFVKPKTPPGSSPVDNKALATTAANLSMNRLLTQFEFIQHLGKGGFGEVLKVRNKIDDRAYAIKIVPLKDESSDKILSEVQTLSKLSETCPGVVRYYNSWIDPEIDTELMKAWKQKSEEEKVMLERTRSERGPSTNLRGDSIYFDGNLAESGGMSYAEMSGILSETLETDSYQQPSPPQPQQQQQPQQQTKQSSPTAMSLADTKIWECQKCHTNYVDWSTSDEAWHRIPDTLQPLNLCVKCFNIALSDTGWQLTSNIVLVPKKMCLYIQMEHCIHTFQSILESEIIKNHVTLWEMFAEVVQILVVIHQAGYIHRDLKPANLLFDDKGKVKISDFGLARGYAVVPNPISIDNCNDCNDEKSRSKRHVSHHMSTAVGTQMYMAPEVAAGEPYNEKVDVFSLGIVAMELWLSALGVKNVRKKIVSYRESMVFPPEFDEIPTQKEIIMKMLQKQAMNRPSSSELLKLLPVPRELNCKQSVEHLLDEKRKDQMRILELEEMVRDLQKQLKTPLHYDYQQ